MATIKEYKCPCCGGAVEFDSKIQKIKCPYCDTEFDTEAFTAHEEEVQNAKPDEMDWETTAGGAFPSRNICSTRSSAATMSASVGGAGSAGAGGSCLPRSQSQTPTGYRDPSPRSREPAAWRASWARTRSM